MTYIARFVNCELVQKFNKEQHTLNKYIVDKFSSDAQWQKDMDAERQRKKLTKSFSEAQKVVWLFQHAETWMMDLVRKELKKMKKTVLANVHDAIFIRQRLSALELSKIEMRVRATTNIDYFALGEIFHSRYNQ